MSLKQLFQGLNYFPGRENSNSKIHHSLVQLRQIVKKIKTTTLFFSNPLFVESFLILSFVGKIQLPAKVSEKINCRLT